MANVTADKRATSNMRRLRKGDKFFEAVRGEWVEFIVEGWVERIPGTDNVRIPVRRNVIGGKITRRVFKGTDRVELV